jgi:gluconolactonase
MKSPVMLLMLLASWAFAQPPVPPGAKVEKIATGFQFVEGPVWRDDLGLLFSDLSGNTAYRWTPQTGAVVYLSPSANSNGLTFDAQGRLLLAQTGLRRVARRDTAGTITSLAASYQGKKLNSPNDLVVKSDGSVFFTDPPFNVPAGQTRELSFSGIFRISPSGTLQLLDSTLVEPNGICFSPDESHLYVDNSSQRVIYVWDVINDSTIAGKHPFASMNPAGYADGMKVDPAGNVFCAGPLGIWVFAPTGAVLDTILVPGQTTNCNWGETDRKTLFMTAGNSVYRIRLATTGVRDEGSLQPGQFELLPNFPNPFNAVTHLRFFLPEGSFVRLKVFDALGREIATLVDGRRDAGSNSVRWDTPDLPSGVFVYRLEAGRFSASRKMVLMK